MVQKYVTFDCKIEGGATIQNVRDAINKSNSYSQTTFDNVINFTEEEASNRKNTFDDKGLVITPSQRKTARNELLVQYMPDEGRLYVQLKDFEAPKKWIEALNHELLGLSPNASAVSARIEARQNQ